MIAARTFHFDMHASFRAVTQSAADVAMDRYANGDAGAFGAVYDAVAPRLHAYLRARSGSDAIADDVVQQTMLRIHTARGSFQQGAQVMPWAYAIARRLLVDRSRRHRREVLTLDGESPAEGASSADLPADDAVHAAQLERRLDVELARLPEAQRAAFELVKREGLSMAEAAAVLGTTATAVKLRAHRAYVSLRAALGSAFGAEGADR